MVEIDSDEVWEKGKVSSKPNIWRKDHYGAWIAYVAYGKDSKYGWEVDHILPVSKGGSDNIDNLRPLHFTSNKRRGDGSRPFTAVTSDGAKNVNL